MKKNKIPSADGLGGGSNGTKLINYSHAITPAIIIFSLFLFALSIVGTASVAASSQIGGGRGLQEEQQQQIQFCGSSGTTDGTSTNTTTTGIVGTANNSMTGSLYQNPEYGIQMLCPENWIYMETDTAPPIDFQVVFMLPMDALELGRAQESQATPEMPPGVSVMIAELPFGNADVRLLGDIITSGLASEGYEIISTNPNATLSGMPALELVVAQPEDGTRQLQVWTVQENRGYGAGYISHESRFDQSLPIAQDMISSFTITDDNTGATNTLLTGDDNNNGSATTVPNTSTNTQSQIPSEESPSTTTTSPTIMTTDGNNTPAMTLEGARQQYLAVWNQTEFHISFSTFIEPGSGTAYGIYEEHDTNNIFRPGETIQLNLEPVGFGHQRLTDDAGNTLYLMNLAADITISDTNGNELASLEDLPLVDFVSHRQNTEMHLAATVTQNQPFPAGDYIITYIIHDNVKGESFQIDKRITIASDDSRITTTSTATGLNTSYADNTQSQTSAESLPPPTTNGGITDTDNNNQTTNLQAARQQYLQEWNRTEFQIVFDTFIEPDSATGYGLYEERENNNNIFRPGETIQLYAEPVGFGHQPIIDDNGDVLYAMVFTADMILSDANGNELTSIEDLPLTDIVSHRQNTEMYLELSVTQDEPFPVGDYIVSYIIHDQVTGESFQVDKRISIATEEGDDNDAGGAASIQEQQQQQQQPQEVEWLQYENTTYGVRMLYPFDWIQQDGTIIDDGFISVSNFYSPEEADYATVVVGIDNTLPSTNLEDSLNYTINSYMQDPILRDFQVLSSTTDGVTVAGMPAYALEASYTDPEFGLQYLLVVETILDNKGYSISYFADPSIYQQYFPIAERMIKSFEIMQQQQDGGEDEGQPQLQQPPQNQEESISPIPGLF